MKSEKLEAKIEMEFDLTPALSSRRGSGAITPLVSSYTSFADTAQRRSYEREYDMQRRLDTVLPLLGGEGWGEVELHSNFSFSLS